MLYFIIKRLYIAELSSNDDKIMKKLEEKLIRLAGVAGTGCVWKVSRFLLLEPELDTCIRQHGCEFCRAVKENAGKVETCIGYDTRELVARLKRNPEPQVCVCHAGVAEVIVPIPPGAAGFTGVVMLGPFRVEGEACRYPEAEEAFGCLPLLRPEAAEGYFEFIPPLFDEVVKHAYADSAGLLPLRPRDERILSVLEFLRRHFAGDPSAVRVAETVFMSPSRLRHLFQQECGIGMSEYLLKLRLRRARRYLLAADWPVSRVAEMSGFSGQSYFTAMFRREFGMPPLRYRRKFGHPPYSV